MVIVIENLKKYLKKCSKGENIYVYKKRKKVNTETIFLQIKIILI